MSAPPDLSRLTAAEREVLTLLAEGHTTKSVAATLGRSEGSVNERLREARRKTGVGSSRELARLLRTQKHRDEQIGMATSAPPREGRTHAPYGVRWQGVFVMTVAFAVLSIAAALLAPAQQAVPSVNDPVFAAAAGDPGSTPWGLHDKLAHEPRAEAWAASNEAALRARYLAVRGVDATSLRVRCGTSVCEVLGRSGASETSPAITRAMATMQGRTFRDALKPAGLENVSSGFGSESNGGKGNLVFLAFWTRRIG